MRRVVVYSDYVCPYCYLAEPALARLRAEEGLATEYRAYELRPAPVPLPDPAAAPLAEEWRRTILPVAELLGVEIRQPGVQPRSRKAHEMAKLAAQRGMFQAVHDAMFRAYFVDGRDIGRIDVLVELGVELGLDRTEVKVTLDIDQWTERVVGEEREGLERGVGGVPTFAAGEETLVGLQPYTVLRAWALGTEAGGGA